MSSNVTLCNSPRNPKHLSIQNYFAKPSFSFFVGGESKFRAKALLGLRDFGRVNFFLRVMQRKLSTTAYEFTIFLLATQEVLRFLPTA
jgi:hypothetical protein